MQRTLFLSLLALLFAPFWQAHAFEQVEAKDFAGDAFVFPDDIRGEGWHLLFLSIGTSQDNGEYQGREVIKWHNALTVAGVIPDQATAWHFPVIDGAPFFVKGVIRKGIAKDYEGLIPPGQGAALFVDDYAAFAAAAGVEADGEPTVILYRVADGVVETWRGAMTASAVEELNGRLGGAAP